MLKSLPNQIFPIVCQFFILHFMLCLICKFLNKRVTKLGKKYSKIFCIFPSFKLFKKS